MTQSYQNEIKGENELQQLNASLNLLRQDNSQMRYQRELMNREYESMMFENTGLYTKLANLEKVFIGESITSEISENGDVSDSQSDSGSSNKRYSHSLLVTENNEIRARIENVETDKIELKGILMKLEDEHTPSTGLTREDSQNITPENMRKALQLKEARSELENQIQLMKSRVQQLTENLLESYPKPSSSSSKTSNKSSYMRFKKQMTGGQR